MFCVWLCSRGERSKRQKEILKKVRFLIDTLDGMSLTYKLTLYFILKWILTNYTQLVAFFVLVFGKSKICIEHYIK